MPPLPTRLETLADRVLVALAGFPNGATPGLVGTIGLRNRVPAAETRAALNELLALGLASLREDVSRFNRKVQVYHLTDLGRSRALALDLDPEAHTS